MRFLQWGDEIVTDIASNVFRVNSIAKCQQ